MAMVSNMQNGGIKMKYGSHKKTDCSYYIVQDEKGKFLQLDTYGSDERQIPGKISQTILFAPEAIKQLKELLAKEF